MKEVPADVKSAHRVIEIIELLATARTGRTFSQLLEVLGYPRSSLHALIRTLVARRWVELDESGHRYRLAIRMWELGQSYVRAVDLAACARPFMQKITDELGETTQLAILDGRYNVYIAKVDGSQRLVLASEVGRRLEAHATGLGKVLLAGLSPEKLSNCIEGVALERFTKHTITSSTRLREQLKVARQQGYATDNQEYTIGVRCIAVPIYNHFDEVTAAMSVSVPTARYTAAGERRITAILKQQARALSFRLGYGTSDDSSVGELESGLL
jgi:DNA-binding IclR family transcriptional regulator